MKTTWAVAAFLAVGLGAISLVAESPAPARGDREARGPSRERPQAKQESPPAPPASFPYDAVLVVGGKPEGLEVPGLDLALRARKAWELLDQAKAYYAIMSGKEFNNKPMLGTTGFKGSGGTAAAWYTKDGGVDRSKEERIKACEMIALILRARGVGRLALKMRPGPEEVAALCKEKSWKKIICVGDGTGPEKPAVDMLKAQGVQVDFAASYGAEEGKKLLSQDMRLTEADRKIIKVDWVKPEDVDVILVKGGPGAPTTRLLTAIRLYQSGYGKYILPAGGGSGHMSEMGEAAAIVCGGFGIPIDRVIYGPGVKSTYNLANAKTLIEKLRLKEDVYCPQGGVDATGREGVRFWDVGMIPYKVLLPRDHNAKVKEILAELEADVPKYEKLAQTGTAEEKADAAKKLDMLRDNKFSQMTTLKMDMNGMGGCGRFVSFPKTPWEWDGASPYPGWYGSEGTGLSGTLGWVHQRAYGGLGAEGIAHARKYIRQDYGVKGPWQDYTDSRIQPDRGSPQWWDKYVKPAGRGARAGGEGGD